jgi:hypothetical protein
MDEQYKEMLEELSKIRQNNKDRKITSIRPTGSSSISGGINHFGGKKGNRILKAKKILKYINHDTKR